MKLELLKKFLASLEYTSLKTTVEQNTFKFNGEYQIINDDHSMTTMTSSKMKEEYKNKNVSIQAGFDSETGKPICITKSFYEIWSEDPNMREYKSLTFDCNIKNVPKSTYNMFTGFNEFKNVDSTNINLDDIFEHFRSLCGYNEDIFNYFIKWIAHLKQKPYEHMQTCFVIISEEGVGKDISFTFLSNIFGKQYCLGTDKLDQICGKFNGSLGGKVLTMINECNPMETRDRQENIKYLITAEEVQIERKYKEPVMVKLFSRFLFFSNRFSAFPIEKGSRRPVISYASNKYLPSNYGMEKSKEHFNNLISQMRDVKYQKAFSDHLQNIDLTKWNMGDVPKSELHKNLEECAISPLVSFVAEFIKNIEGSKCKISSQHCRNQFIEYLQRLKLNYEYSQSKFGLEIKMIFKVETVKNSSIYYIFDKPTVIDILEKKYGYNFSQEATEKSLFIEDESEDEKYDEKQNEITFEVKTDVLTEIEQLKKIIENQNQIIEDLKNKLEKSNKIESVDTISQESKTSKKSKEKLNKPPKKHKTRDEDEENKAVDEAFKNMADFFNN